VYWLIQAYKPECSNCQEPPTTSHHPTIGWFQCCLIWQRFHQHQLFDYHLDLESGEHLHYCRSSLAFFSELYTGDFNADGRTDFLRQEKGVWDDDANNTANVFLSIGSLRG
jgi:hypothetical protein